ncbi:MAG: GNAT superfamily N-acetyltransferase [Pseudohongiellaceae bacterium]|jgi:GNAT superfamily N-acetyltransferase
MTKKTASDPLSDYPQTAELKSGKSITLKAMHADDRSAIMAFAKQLPEEDLLFLTIDLTQKESIDGWLNNIKTGSSISLVAYAGDELVGYATVHKETAPWTRKVGEIRVNIAPQMRSQGLGRLLISHIFDIARDNELTKILARMTSEQKDAQTAFGKLGFVAEALLADFIVDRKGVSHDLVMMTFDVDGLSDQAGGKVKI